MEDANNGIIIEFINNGDKKMRKILLALTVCLASLCVINAYSSEIYNHTKYEARINHAGFRLTPHQYISPHGTFKRTEHGYVDSKYTNLVILKSTENSNYECEINHTFWFQRGGWLSIYEGRYHSWCHHDICVRQFTKAGGREPGHSCNFKKY